MSASRDWEPIEDGFLRKPPGEDWAEFFKTGSAREFDLGNGATIVGVRTSRRSVMLQGRRVDLSALAGFPSRRCRRVRAAA